MCICEVVVVVVVCVRVCVCVCVCVFVCVCVSGSGIGGSSGGINIYKLYMSSYSLDCMSLKVSHVVYLYINGIIYTMAWYIYIS